MLVVKPCTQANDAKYNNSSDNFIYVIIFRYWYSIYCLALMIRRQNNNNEHTNFRINNKGPD